MMKNKKELQLNELQTMVDILSWRALRQPEKLAFTFLSDDETKEANITYKQLDTQARAVAAKLQSTLKPGECVLLLEPQGLEFIAAFLGCLYAGVVAIPAYPPGDEGSLARINTIAVDAGATAALTTGSLQTYIKRLLERNDDLASLQLLSSDDLPGAFAEQWRKPTLKKDNVAYLQYTSGSTGNPKGVMISHGNLMHNKRMITGGVEYEDNMDDAVGVGWVPLFHDMGLICNLLQPLYLGASIVLMSPVAFIQKPIRWLSAIPRYGATASGGPNFAYDLCVQKIAPDEREQLDLGSWQIAFIGAEPVRAETLERFTAAFAPFGFRKEAFYPSYGMAEATLVITGGRRAAKPVVRQFDGTALEQGNVVTASATESKNRHLVGCGQALQDQQVMLVDPQTRTPSPSDQVGEIWVKGPNVAQGYWKHPEATEETFNAFLANNAQGPFLRTGDLGFVQEGELYVVGRLKDVMIFRGRNHYPQDIELTVEQCQPALHEGCAAAFSIEAHSEGRLVLVCEVKRRFIRKLNTKEVVDAIQQAVLQKHELQVHAVELLKPMSIPKTSSGKIQRYACKAGFLANSLTTVAKWKQKYYSSAGQPVPAKQRDLLPQLEKASAGERKKLLMTYLQNEAARIMELDKSRLPRVDQWFFQIWNGFS